jgi:hypothetical protein
MAEILRLFVSATNDLEAERAVIGRAVADLPVEIRMEIRRTPAAGAKYDDIYELIANVDRVYFLMGADITAPAGAEWHLAWQLERSVYPLKTDVRRSSAGSEFMRSAPISWQRFRNATELARLVTMDLVRMLQHPTNRYGLTVTELELLALHGKRMQRTQVALGNEPGGAEGGGVILDSGRREPLDGVAIEE